MQPQRHRPGPGFTALHLVQPVDGGVARVVIDLVAAQLSSGTRVVVACPEDGPLAPAVAGSGAEVRLWRARRSPGTGLRDEVQQVSRIVAHVRPDLVHAHSAKAGLAGRLAVRGRVPTVFQPHAWSFEAVSGVTARLALRWERYAVRWADRIVCVSDAERRTGERAGIRGRWSVVRNGVDTKRFHPGDTGTARANLPQLAAEPPSGPVIVCVGRLCRQKGQDVLLRAWATLAPRWPHARLVLVGDGPDAAVLRATAPPSVLFAGAAPDSAPWYQAADLVVMPSRWEGMALAPLEAMASGRPVVLTDVDGARESLPPGSERHCLTFPDDPAALAAAIDVLLADAPLRGALGRRAHQHALRTFDVRRTTEAVAALYREVAAAPRPERRESIPQ